MEAFKVGKGGVHGKAVMVGKGMAVNTLQRAVTAVAQSLNDILVGNTCSMEGGGHMMPVVMQSAVRESIPLQESCMA